MPVTEAIRNMIEIQNPLPLPMNLQLFAADPGAGEKPIKNPFAAELAIKNNIQNVVKNGVPLPDYIYSKCESFFFQFVTEEPNGRKKINVPEVVSYFRQNITYVIAGKTFCIQRDDTKKYRRDDEDNTLTRVLIRSLMPPDVREERDVSNVLQALKTPDKKAKLKDVPLDVTEEEETWDVPDRTLKSVKEADLPPIYFAVEGMIPAGLSVISAPMKAGKSWLMLDLCIAVASGSEFLGRSTTQSEAVYFDLEEGEIGIHSRLQRRSDDEVPDGVHVMLRDDFITDERDFPTIDSGFEGIIESIIAKYPAVKLFVIDTFAFIKGQKNRGESDYEADYRIGRKVKKIADNHGLAVVVVTHSTKLTHLDDPMANISGSVGLPSAADALMVICKEKRFDKSAVLSVTGRMAESVVRQIEFDTNSCKWSDNGAVIEDEGERERAANMKRYTESTIRTAVLRLCEDRGADGWSGRASGLITDAANLGVNILDSPREVGAFLKTMKPFFSEVDRVKMDKIDNGTGSTIYRFNTWEHFRNGSAS